MIRRKTNRRHMTGDHHGRAAGRATLLVTPTDEILGTHRIRRTTTGCVALLALIAGTVSYLHMHRLVALHGQPGWVAALTPLSVDGMIVASSTTLLAGSRTGQRGSAQSLARAEGAGRELQRQAWH